MKKVLYNFIFSLILIYGCASIGNPTGGPKDTMPPHLVRCDPPENSTHFNKKRINIYFDELVDLQDESKKIIVSPPMKIKPSFMAYYDRIRIQIADTLKSSTTYTIDFTDAIVDYNEKNKFGDYAYSFSTGAVVDSMRLGGYIVDASNLNPVSGVYVGVHHNPADTTFRKTPFSNISRSNEKGKFSVKGLKSERYNIYALNDKNGDYKFDQPGEEISFSDSSFLPYCVPVTCYDTIWIDSLTIDSIRSYQITGYKPDNIVLKYFAEDFGRQYLAKKGRPERNRIDLIFGDKAKTLPAVSLLNADKTDWYVLEENNTKDTLIYWIKDSSVIKMDTILLKVDYFKTDSLNILQPYTDTLSLVPDGLWKEKRKAEARKKKEERLRKKREKEKPAEKEKTVSDSIKIEEVTVPVDTGNVVLKDTLRTDSIPGDEVPVPDSLTVASSDEPGKEGPEKEEKKGLFSGLGSLFNKKEESKGTFTDNVPHLKFEAYNLSGTVDIYAKPSFKWKYPLKKIDESAFHLYIKEDTLWVEKKFSIKQSDNLRTYYIDSKWGFGQSYKFVADSGYIESLYGITNTGFSTTFSVKKEEDYSRLILYVYHLKDNSIIQLLNKSDKVLRSLPLDGGIVDFKYLDPGTYYIRAIDDRNGNGKWDTGDYSGRKQPEDVFYDPKPVILKANWDVEEEWDVTAVPLLLQKPKELIKKSK